MVTNIVHILMQCRCLMMARFLRSPYSSISLDFVDPSSKQPGDTLYMAQNIGAVDKVGRRIPDYPHRLDESLQPLAPMPWQNVCFR